MKLIRAKNSGFCMGVRRAVDIAMGQKGQDACILGDLIHSDYVTSVLKKNGIDTVYSVQDAEKYGTVVIRSHGEPPEIFEYFRDKNVKIIDTTCAFVKRIHKIVTEKYESGYDIFIAGDKGHAEVAGINGHAGGNACIIRSFEEFAEGFKGRKACLVAQTTFSAAVYTDICEKIVKVYAKVVELFDTICYNTYARQDEAQDISAKSDIVLVIGGKNSSNSSKLFEICSGLTKAFLISKTSDLDGIDFKPDDTVGLVTGASAPEELITEVIFYMSDEKKLELENLELTESTAPATEVSATEVSETAPAEVAPEVTPEVAPAPVATEAAPEVAPAEVATEAAPEVAPAEVAPEVTPEVAPAEAAPDSAPAESALEAAPVEEAAPEAKPAKEGRKENANLSEFERAMARIDKEPFFKEGRRYKVKVISADEKGISVAMTTGKRDGFIPAEEAALEGYNPADFKADDEIMAVLTSAKVDQATGCYSFSKKQIDLAKLADKEVDKIRDGSEFSLVMTSDTKGGLVGKLASYRVFVPLSHIKEGFPKDLKQFVGKPLRLTALEIDDEKHKIVASQRKILEAERTEKEAEFWDRIEVNEIVTGKVLRTTSFGAFVDVYGYDCLAHIGDLSWVRINKVEEILTIGESYDFVILSADREKRKVSLGYKQINKHPFDAAIELHPVGSIIKGKVVRLVAFGAFVEIEKGVDALLHLSEASHSFIKSIGEAVKVGDEIEAMVTRIDPSARKISLSIKAMTPAPEAGQDETAEGGDVTAQEKPVRENRSEKRDYSKRPAGGGDRRPSRQDARDGNPTEWSEDNSNNPFAELLKDVEIKE